VQTFNGIGTTLYGQAKRQPLTGREALDAEERGYEPYAYNAVKWFVVFFLPLLPLGSYIVVKKKTKFFSFQSPQYLMRSTSWDWKQIFVHYLIAYGSVAFVVITFLWLMTSGRI
jgi:hypothetical protein